MTLARRGRFLLDYIDLLMTERVGEAEGFRHTAPLVSGDPAAASAHAPAWGRERWVINKVRALGSWYTKGFENGSHLRVAINSAESVPQLREIIDRFFCASPVSETLVGATHASPLQQ